METKKDQPCKILHFKPRQYAVSIADLGASLICDTSLSSMVSATCISPMLSVIVSDKSTISTALSGNSVDLRAILDQATKLHEDINPELASAFMELLNKIRKDDNNE